MAINLYDQPQPLQFRFSRTPLEPLAAALQMKQKRFDTYRAAADEFSQKQLPSLEKDRPRANTILADVQDRIDSLVEKAGGDYSAIGSDLYSMKRDMFRNFSPGGEAYAIMANKNAFDTAVKSERTRLDKGEITDEQFGLWYRNTLDTYEGIGDFNPVSGQYNVLNPEAVAKYVDPMELGIDIAKELEPFVDEIKYDQLSGNWIVTKGQKTETLSPDLIRQVVSSRLYSSDPYMNYIQQLSKWRGYEGEDLLKAMDLEVGNTANTLGATFARQNISQEMGMKANPFALARYRHSLSASLLQPFLDTMRQRYAPVTSISKTDKLTENIFTPSKTVTGDLPAFTPYQAAQTITGQTIRTEPAGRRTFQDIATKPEFADQLDQNLAQAILKQNPHSSDKQLLDLYNKSLDNTANLPSYELAIDNPNIQKQLTEGMVAKGNLYKFPLRVKKKDGTWTDPMQADEALSELGISYDEIYDAEKDRTKAAISGMQGLTEGIGPGLTIAVPGKGTVAITSWNQAAETIGQQFGALTDPLRTGQKSPTLSLPYLGTENPVYSDVEYNKLADGSVQKRLKIYDAVNNQDITDQVNLPAVSAQMESAILQDFLPKVKASESSLFLPYYMQQMQ